MYGYSLEFLTYFLSSTYIYTWIYDILKSLTQTKISFVLESLLCIAYKHERCFNDLKKIIF